MLHTQFRPKKFSDVVGQESELAVIQSIFKKGWKPTAIMLAGQFGTGKCVVGDTKVLVSGSGLVPISSFYRGEKEGEYRPFEDLLKVWSKDGYAPVSHFYYGGIKPCLKVSLSNGLSVSGTYVHPVRVQTHEGLSWKTLTDLKVGDLVATQGPTDFTFLANPQFFLLGFSSALGPRLSIIDGAFVLEGTKKDLRRLVKDFGVSDVQWSARGTRISSVELVSYLSFMDFLSSNLTDSLLDFLLSSPSELRASFVQGISIASLSYLSNKPLKFRENVTLSKLQLLLTSVGVYSEIKPNSSLSIDWSTTPFGSGTNSPSKEMSLSSTMETDIHFQEILKAASVNGRKLMVSKEVLLSVEKLSSTSLSIYSRSLLKDLLQDSKFTRLLTPPDLLLLKEYASTYFVRVSSIEDVGNQEVYDLSVPSTTSFTANGILVHNTTLARLIARSILCEGDKQDGYEPCGSCPSCISMDTDSNSSYIEIDSASHGLVADIRSLKDEVSYRTIGGKPKIVVMDECLSGDTLIHLSGGMKVPLKDLVYLSSLGRPNSVKVLSYNLSTGFVEPKRVLNFWTRELRNDLLRISVSPSSPPSSFFNTTISSIKVTPEHKIWSEFAGSYVYARDLKVGDTLRFYSKGSTLETVSVSFIESSPTPEIVYDMEVEDNHNFLANGCLVSNCHMISNPGQNAMLKILEEGQDGLLFMLATTNVESMLPTIVSRCVYLNLKLLTASEILKRLKVVAASVGIKYEDKALKLISSYVRGHLRDALMMLEQMSHLSTIVTEEAVRLHLRLDRVLEIYEFLIETDRKVMMEKLEQLMCSYPPSDLVELIAKILLDSYKLHLGVGEYTQVDQVWLKKVFDAQGSPSNVLERAERALLIDTSFSSITYGVVSLFRLFGSDLPSYQLKVKPSSSPQSMRKPGK